MHLMISRIQAISIWSISQLSISHLQKEYLTQRLANWILLKAHHYSLYLKTQQQHDNQAERMVRFPSTIAALFEYLEAMLGDFFEVLREEQRKARWHHKKVPPTQIIGYALELLFSTLQLGAENACRVLQTLLFSGWRIYSVQTTDTDHETP